MRALLAMQPATPGQGVGPDSAPAIGTAPLEWSCNPWRERPGRAALAVVVALGACLLVFALGVPVLMGGLLCVVWLSALAPSFTVARCRIDAEGVAVRRASGWTRRAWDRIRRARVTPHGLLVSPFSRPSWMDPYRALYLPFPAARGAALAETIRRHLHDHDLPS